MYTALFSFIVLLERSNAEKWAEERKKVKPFFDQIWTTIGNHVTTCFIFFLFVFFGEPQKVKLI